MVNFLIFSAIGPTKHFFGCLPIVVGMGVLCLIQVGIIALDILEHEQLFEKTNVMNKWATMSIQIVIALISLVGVFWQNKFYSVVVYFTLVGASVATATEKIFKIIALGESIFNVGSIKHVILTFQFIYSARAAFEFIIYFYASYIAYSFSSEIINMRPSDEILLNSRNTKQ